jgi:hypothetical protein
MSGVTGPVERRRKNEPMTVEPDVLAIGFAE